MGATGAPGTLSALVAATANENTQVTATGRPFSVALQSSRFDAEICFCASCGAREDQCVLSRASAAATYKRSAWREVAGDISRHSGYINQLLLFEPIVLQTLWRLVRLPSRGEWDQGRYVVRRRRHTDN